MTLCKELHADPVIRALLWCLVSDEQLNEESLLESGMGQAEARALLQDEEGLLKRMLMRASISERFSVDKLAALLRSRLAEHVEQAESSAQLAVLLRCMKGLPQWLFPEWNVEPTDADLEGLLKLAGFKSRLSVGRAS